MLWGHSAGHLQRGVGQVLETGEGGGLKGALSQGAATPGFQPATVTPRLGPTVVTSSHLLQEADDLGSSCAVSQCLSAGSFISKASCEAENTPLQATFALQTGHCDC